MSRAVLGTSSELFEHGIRGVLGLPNEPRALHGKIENMDKYAASRLFAEVVDQYKDKLGDDIADAFLQGYAAGEQDIVFPVLLENLREMNCEVDQATRTKLHQI